MRFPTPRVSTALCIILIASCSVARAADAKPAEENAEQKIEPAKVTLDRPVDFSKDIAPILNANCTACHNAAISENELNLEDVASILAGGQAGPAVVPNDPDKSLLYQLVSRAKQPAMPPLPNGAEAQALTPRQVGLIRLWIDEGAKKGTAVEAAAIAWKPVPSGIHSIYAVALSPWSDLIACGRANRVTIYDAGDGAELARLTDPELLRLEYESKPMYRPGATHRAFVQALAFSPDGNLLATGGYRVVKLWQREPIARRFELSLSAAGSALAVDSAKKWAAVASADHSIRLWNLTDGKPGRTLTGHTQEVTGLAFSPDGKKLVSGSTDKTLRLWDIADGKLLGQHALPQPSQGIAFDGGGQRIVSADADGIARVWSIPGENNATQAENKQNEEKKDAEKTDEEKANAEKKVEPPQPLRELKGHSGPLTGVTLVPGQAGQVATAGEDGKVRIWNLENGKQIRTFSLGKPVADLAFSGNGELLVAAGAEGTAKIWQTNNGQQKSVLSDDLARIRHLKQLEESRAVAKQRVQLATTGLQNAEKARTDREQALKEATEARPKADTALAAAEKKVDEVRTKLEKAKMSLSEKPDDNGRKRNVRNVERELDKEEDALQAAKNAQTGSIRNLDLSKKNLEIAVADLKEAQQRKQEAETREKQSVAEHEAAKKEQPPAPVAIRAVAFSDDGKRVATADETGTITFWNVETGTPQDRVADRRSAVAAIAFGPADSLVSISADKTAALHESRSRWSLVARLGAKPDAPLDVTASPIVDRVLCLDFSPDGKLLATGSGDPSRSGEIILWDVESRKLVRALPEAHSDTVFGLEFSRDGERLVSGGADKFVRIFDVATGKPLKALEGHTHHVLDVSWKADGSLVASAGADELIKVWNAETGEQTRTIKNYGKQVTTVSFIGVGENLVSCSGDANIRFHRASNGRSYRNFGGARDFVYAAAAARDESLVVAGGLDGVLRIWNGKDGKLLHDVAPPQPALEDDAQAAK